MNRFKTIDMELSLIRYFNNRINLIIHNIFWGLFNHECDLFILTKSGCGYEVEIKVSLQDLKKDKLKRHKHKDHLNRIKYLYFAIPHYLEKDIEHIPSHAGIIVVNKDLYCKKIRNPKQLSNYKFSIEEKFKIARLGAIRIWTLKSKIKQQNKKISYLKNKLSIKKLKN